MTTDPLIWYAVRTKPGRERHAIEGLRERRFGNVYMPVERRVRRTALGRKTVEHPLVAGYLFVGIGPDSPDLYGVLRIEAVADIVRHASGEVAEIRREPDGFHFVYAMQASQARGDFDFTPKTRTWKIGESAKITAGAWTGCIGEIVSAEPGRRAHVMLTGLWGGKTGIPVEPKHLEPA